jgi:exonuclease III
MRFGTWNVSCLYTSGALTTVASELARYKLDLVGVQEIRWDKGDTVRAGDYIFIYEKGNSSHQLEQDCLYSVPPNNVGS